MRPPVVIAVALLVLFGALAGQLAYFEAGGMIDWLGLGCLGFVILGLSLAEILSHRREQRRRQADREEITTFWRDAFEEHQRRVRHHRGGGVIGSGPPKIPPPGAA